MAWKQCQHFNRVNGVIQLDFARREDPDGSMYTGEVNCAVCEACGPIELYASLHHLLCDWLRKA
jgi:hypothetical protein